MGAKRQPFGRLGEIMGLFWTIWNSNYGNSWEQPLQQLRARSGRLFEGKIMVLFWTIGNHNYGREAAAFLNWATAINKWVTIGRLLETTTAAKRAPS